MWQGLQNKRARPLRGEAVTGSSACCVLPRRASRVSDRLAASCDLRLLNFSRWTTIGPTGGPDCCSTRGRSISNEPLPSTLK